MRRLSYEAVKDVKPRPKGESGAQRQDINGDRNDVKSGAQHQDANGDNNDVKSGAQHQEAVQDVKSGAKRQAGAQRQDITQACAAFEHKACAD